MTAFLLAWVLVPLELCVLSVGCGLLVAELAGRAGAPRAEPLPAVLVPPVGFGLVVVIASVATNWELPAPLAGVAPLAVALAGLVAGRRRIAAWLRLWRPAAALWPFAA